MVITALVLAVVGAAMSVYEWQHVPSKIDDAGLDEIATASVGVGIWVMIVGFVVAVVCLASALPSDPLDAYATANPCPSVAACDLAVAAAHAADIAHREGQLATTQKRQSTNSFG